MSSLHYLDREFDMSDPRAADSFDELTFWSSRFGGLLFDHLEIIPGSTVLDLACGTGFPLAELARVHDETSRIVGLDLWRPALRRGRKKIDFFGTPRAHIVEGDGREVPFASETFDLVTSNLGANNFDDRRAAWSECARVLRSGARFVMTTNTVGHFVEFYDTFASLLEESGYPNDAKRLRDEERHRSSADELAAELHEVGLEQHRVHRSEFVMRYASGKALFEHPLTWLGFLPSWKAAVQEAEHRSIFAELERRLDAKAPGDSGLVMTVPMLYLEFLKKR